MPTTKNGKVMERAWHIRVSVALDDMLISYIELDTHTNKGEYIREAIRVKLQNDFEHLEQIKRFQAQERETHEDNNKDHNDLNNK